MIKTNELPNIVVDLLVVLKVLSIPAITAIVACKKLKLNKKQFKVALLFSLLLTLIPSSDIVRHPYFQIIGCFILAILIYTIFQSPLRFSVKISVIVILIAIYHKNIILISGIIHECYNFNRVIKLNQKDPRICKQMTVLYKSIGINMINNFNRLPDHPTIILANYCRDRIENSMYIMLPRKLSIITQYDFKKYINCVNKNPIYITGYHKGNFEYIEKQVKIALDKGSDIFVYINKASYYNYIGKLRSGMFKIALKHNISITPVAFDYIDTYYGTIPNQNLCIKVGETVYEKDLVSAKYRVRKFFVNTLKEFKLNKYNLRYKLS